MDKETAVILFNKVELTQNDMGCWIPRYKTRSIRYMGKMISLAYLAYVLSDEKSEYHYKQRIIRVCNNINCFNPEHILFSDEHRFWFYVNRNSFFSDDCWNWTHSKDGGGYGVFISYKYGREKAHRIAYMETYGEIPIGMFVCHKCDNPSCCNPSHLFLGTNDDNMLDKVRKNRQTRLIGNQNGRAILTQTDIINMRADYKSGKFSYRQLVDKYKISQTQVARIIKKESWAWA